MKVTIPNSNPTAYYQNLAQGGNGGSGTCIIIYKILN
jgi:hypothetical protein